MEDAQTALAQNIPHRYHPLLLPIAFPLPRQVLDSSIFPSFPSTYIVHISHICIGQDLHGNTYWEFKDRLNAERLRRIVRYHRRTHFSDVQVSPQWHQWLRHTRSDPPSIQEQQADVVRQVQLKHNAMLADQRWANKERYLEEPNQRQGLPGA